MASRWVVGSAIRAIHANGVLVFQTYKFGADKRWLGSTGAADAGEWWVCYHGTPEGNLKSIIQKGLLTSMSGGRIFCAQNPSYSLSSMFASVFEDQVLCCRFEFVTTYQDAFG